MNIRLVMTGGGSGGHIYPGIPVIDYLCGEGIVSRGEILWICSKSERDKKILSDYHISYEPISSGKLRRYWTWENITDLARCAAGFFQALKLLRHTKAQCVFSKGGFVSVPVVYAAALLGIPVVSHESDIDPGLSTRINQRVSSRLCVPFEASRRYYPKRKDLRVTGNPVSRISPGGIKNLPVDIPDGALCLLVHGGSLGSASLNTLFWQLLDELPEDLTIVHVLGRSEMRKPPQRRGYHPLTYVEGGFRALLERSDLVISRAGAGSLWEQASAGKAMVLFPLGKGISRGEQERNARYFEHQAGALCFFQDAIDIQRVIYGILSLLSDPGKRMELSEQARSLVHDQAARLIGQTLREYLLPGD